MSHDNSPMDSNSSNKKSEFSEWEKAIKNFIDYLEKSQKDTDVKDVDEKSLREYAEKIRESEDFKILNLGLREYFAQNHTAAESEMFDIALNGLPEKISQCSDLEMIDKLIHEQMKGGQKRNNAQRS